MLFLDEKADFYENKLFIENDPLQIPHRFTLKEDIEISAFLTATISWGNRKSIINSAEKMLNYMEDSPFDFVNNFSEYRFFCEITLYIFSFISPF